MAYGLNEYLRILESGKQERQKARYEAARLEIEGRPEINDLMDAEIESHPISRPGRRGICEIMAWA